MANIKIEIVSKEMTKPLNYENLKTHQLSWLDQIAPSFYIPIVLFYSNHKNDQNHINPTIVVQRLKSSLSQTLSIYHSFAGTVTPYDTSFLEVCQNDDGVPFTEARVHADLSTVLEKPDTCLVRRLIPIDPHTHGGDGAPVPAMAVQSNEFDCGGIAVGVCLSHKIADGTTLSSFLSAWSSHSYGGGGVPPPPPCLDAAGIFPPLLDGAKVRFGNTAGNTARKGRIVARRFVFGAPGLARLRAEASVVGSPKATTRVEAVTSLISKAAIETEESEIQTAVILHVVNLRPRMNNSPLLGESAVGNIWSMAAARVLEARDQSLSSLAARVREEMRKVDGEFTEKLKSPEGIAEALEVLGGLAKEVREGVVPFYKFSSWVRFPIYEIDLGLGKPAWACTAGLLVKGAVVLMSDKGEAGIEAWVSLEEQHMARFETNVELLSFASLAPGS